MIVSSISATVSLDASKLQQGMAQAKQDVLGFNTALTASFKQTEAVVNKALDGITARSKTAGAALQLIASQGNNAGQQLENGFGKRLDALSQRLDKLGHGAVDLGKKWSLNITAPLVGLGATAVNIEAQFESAMNQLASATGASSVQMEALSGKAKALGADLTLPNTSAKSAGEAMLALAKGGLSVRDVFEAAKPAMQLSAAGFIDNKQAAEILVRTLDQFGLTGKDAAGAADALAAAGNRTTGGITGVSEALKQAGTVMHVLHVPLNDAVTAISLLGRSGLTASVAGSALKTSFALLADPSKKAASILHELGINLFDNAGHMKSLRDVAETLHETLGKLTEQQRLQVEHTLGGVRAMQALAVLARNGAVGFDDMARHVNVSGKAAELAAAQMKGLPGAMLAVKTAFMSAAQSAIEPLSKDLAALAMRVGQALSAFASLPSPVRAAITVFAAGVAAAGPLLVGIGQLSLGLKALLPTFALVRTAALATWATIGGPATIAIGIATAAIAAFTIAWRNDWLDIREVCRASFDTLRDLFNAVLPTLQTAWQAFTDAMSGNWSGAWDRMKQVVTNVLQFVARAMTDPVGLIKELVSKLGTNFQQELVNSASTNAAPKAPTIPDLGPSRPIFDFVGNGTFNPGLAALKAGKTGAGQEPTSPLNDRLNDALTEAQLKLRMLRKGLSEEFTDLVIQYRPLTDARLKDLFAANQEIAAATKHLELSKHRKEVLADLHAQASGAGFTQTGKDLKDLFGLPSDTDLDRLSKTQRAQLAVVQSLRQQAQVSQIAAEWEQRLEDARNTAGIRASLAAQDAQKGFDQLLKGGKLAAFAWSQFQVILSTVDAKTQAFIKHAFQITQTQQAYENFAQRLTSVFETAFTTLDKGFSGMVQSFVQGFEKMLQQMAAQYLASQLAKLFLNTLGSAFGGSKGFADVLGSLSGRASGGLVAADTPYLVGEHGPELFTPGRSGRVLSNPQTAAAMGGGGGTINQTIHIHTADVNSFNRSQHQVATDMRRMVQQAGKRNGR